MRKMAEILKIYLKKLRRTGIDNQMGIERKANEWAYKSNKTKTFRYGNNIIIITKVKN